MSDSQEPKHFIRQIVEQDLRDGTHERLVTRFPPEPNGYLHIGHAKSICLNFGLAEQYAGACYLRLDDTNPTREDAQFVEAIKRDVRWLGFDWGERLTHASDYFERLYEYAEQLVRDGKAYVDDQDAEQIRTTRGTLTSPGTASPCRERTTDENLDLLRRMRAGEFADGSRVLRARIDMAAPNLNLRDPVLYRIRRVSHQMTGDTWRIYPMYDFTHGLCDALEGVTHSLCTLEFEDHRALYDWFLDQLPVPARPRQYEFSRLNLTYTVLSKRRLIELVEGRHVDGWDDPRMPTLSGLRRRGYTPAAIRDFCARVGVTRNENLIDLALLESCLREDLDQRAQRRMAVLRPLKLVIENYPEGQEELFEAANHPQRPEFGTRQVPFGREIYIERDDFMQEPPRKFFRLAPGREVRLRFAYLVTCNEVVRDPHSGDIVELRCSYDPQSRGGQAPDGRKVKGTLHWVAAHAARSAEVRLYDRLFNEPNPVAAAGEGSYLDHLNPHSLEVISDARVEPVLADAPAGEVMQFERLGYFVPDGQQGALVFNRAVTLRDSWGSKRG